MATFVVHSLCCRQYHIMMDDVEEVVVRDLEIYVDVFQQLEIYKAHGGLDATSGLPIFPLNTGSIVVCSRHNRHQLALCHDYVLLFIPQTAVTSLARTFSSRT
jgi:hypothetical protein